MTHLENALRKSKNIAHSELSIYDSINIGDKRVWLISEELEAILNYKLRGISLADLALRTRSKRVKIEVCKALGYPIPKSFKKTKPRFLGQKFDIYTQKSNNLQVWNEDLDLSRRYVLIKVNEENIITQIKVVVGSSLAPLDTTGTLTQKYQARLNNIENQYELFSSTDTAQITQLYSYQKSIAINHLSPIDGPIMGQIFPIGALYKKLKMIIGKSFKNPGSDQERNRGAELHKLVCKTLGYSIYKDDGQFPDVRNQLLEIKLQTSSTIDLGLISPDSEAALDMEEIEGVTIRHCDVRYAIFCGQIRDESVKITHLILTTGKDFFKRFPKFGGKGLNKKIQIRLPDNYFDS